MSTTTDCPDHYLPGPVYDRLRDELAALPMLPASDHTFDAPTWAVEILGLAGIWPETCAPELGPTIDAAAA